MHARNSNKPIVAALALLMLPSRLLAAEYPAPREDNVVLRNFEFASGQSLPEVRMHYLTLGQPQRDEQGVVRNAILILHGTTGSSAQFLRPEFADELFGPGQPLDATRYYLILPDNIGHGESTKPSDGLRGRFPRYGCRDMVAAQHRLLTEGLGVNHLRLVMGTSMGGMHAWLWGQTYPNFMDALMPMACVPAQISGRNRVWRRIVIDTIRTDPEWNNGDYMAQPRGLRTALQMMYLMSSNPVRRLAESPTLTAADEALDRYTEERLAAADANDMLYAFEASHDYDPAPGLEKIRAPLLAINSADDLINPPELGILEREIVRVKGGRAIVLPLSDQTQGHGTHSVAAVWKQYLSDFLERTDPSR
ncbi:MAG TPA: alpha/beta fold hydrolase [Lacipirellulaceae bacterium]|jgi:homoserine O-acetyltransferase|nr:alpha/beta fold hydrolase [Lacipirellulaceae bacterium]